MRAAAKCPGGRPRVVIEINLETHKMNRCILPAMRDGVASIIHLDWFAREQATITQFIEERQQPAFSRQRRPSIAFRQLLSRSLESHPCTQ